MNTIRYIAILFLIISCYCIKAQTDTTITKFACYSAATRSVSISGTICLGKEIGFNGSVEYENVDWGKLIIRPQLSSLRSQNDVFNGILLDLGVGYGYQALRANKQSLYTNIYLTYLVCGTKGLVDGPSVIVELEYKLKLKHNYLIIAPYFRGAKINNAYLSSENKSDFSYGFRIGIAHDFELSD